MRIKRLLLSVIAMPTLVAGSVLATGTAQATPPAKDTTVVQWHRLPAAPAASGVSSTQAVVCGYNDNINNRAIWRNCGWNTTHIETTAWLGSLSYQCVPPYSDYDLGPTWFISSSRSIGVC